MKNSLGLGRSSQSTYNYYELFLATKIADNIYLGNWSDAKRAPYRSYDTLCVIETRSRDLPKHTTHYVPILAHDADMMESDYEIFIPELPPRALLAKLDRCVEIISQYAQDQKDLLVHCYEGRERSPLTLAYWLVKTQRKKDLDEAYVFLQSLRPIVEDRRHWIEMDKE